MSLQLKAIRYWQMGQYDTVDIAAKLKASEAEVYRALFIDKRPKPARARKPRKDRGPRRRRVQAKPIVYTTYHDNRFVKKGVL